MYVRVEQVASHFGVSTSTVWRWKKEGLIRYYGKGRTIRFIIDEVAEDLRNIPDKGAEHGTA